MVFADLDDGRVLHRVEVPAGDVRANFSPDGRWYAYGGSDGTVGVIDVATGEHHGSGAPLHQGPRSVGHVLARRRDARQRRLRRPGRALRSATATPRASFQPGPPNLDVNMTYDEDGRTIVLAYHDGSVLTFDTDPAAWEEHACAVAGRNLTEQEWRDAFGDRPYRETCPDS